MILCANPHTPVVNAPAHRRCQLGDEVARTVIDHRVRRVEAQAVEVELVNPVGGVLNEKRPDLSTVLVIEIDRRAPC